MTFSVGAGVSATYSQAPSLGHFKRQTIGRLTRSVVVVMGGVNPTTTRGTSPAGHTGSASAGTAREE